MRALELTAPISRNPTRILPTVVEELAARLGDAPALLSDRECMSYRALFERSNQYARWALAQGLTKGEVVGLLMANRPEYFAIWLGIVSVGGVVALLNTNLVGASLAHCIDAVSPRHLIVSEEHAETAVDGDARPGTCARRSGSTASNIPGFGGSTLEIQETSCEIRRMPRRATVSEHRGSCPVYLHFRHDRLPKAANVSHARVMQWSYWFAGMMDPSRKTGCTTACRCITVSAESRSPVQPLSRVPRWSFARSSPSAGFGTTS